MSHELVTVAAIGLAVAVSAAACTSSPAPSAAPLRSPARTASPDAAAPPPAGSSVSALPATPEADAALSEAGADAQGASDSSDDEGASGDASLPKLRDARAVGPRPRFYCFSWVHHADHSTDCYASRAVCERERRSMARGHRGTIGCELVVGGYCTKVSRGAGTPQTTRCFASAWHCGQYREYVAGNGLSSTDCEEH